ncbi:MAG: myo-inositol-1(or 4)-monophosphatase, partial [Marinobacter psychrophilus]
MITQMQPAIKMALRVARQGSDYLKAHFERQEPSDKDNSERERQLDRVEKAIYDNFVEQLEKAYKDHNIAPLNAADAGTYDKSWHIFPVLGRDNFLRGIPEFVLALAQKKNNRIESLLIVNPITGEEYAASRGHGAALNSRRVRVSEVRQLTSAALATNVLDQARKDDNPQLWGEIATVLATNSRIFR